MSTLYNLLLLGIVSAITLSSCSNLTSQEKQIVGKYYVSETEEVDTEEDETKMTLTIEMEQEYKKDKTTAMSGTIKVFAAFEDYENYSSVTLEYSISASGTWDIKGNEIIERANPQKIKFDFIKSSSLQNDELSRAIIKLIKNNMESIIPSMRKEMANSTSEIISITDYEMVLRDTDDDTETTHIKIK